MSKNNFEEHFTPQKIVEGSIRFRIPLYQRPYTWEESQILQLLTDLWGNQNSGTLYYIGILSIGNTETAADYFDLIDGQQRITTLLLVGKVFFSEYNQKSWDDFIHCVDFYGRKDDDDFIKNNNFNSNNNRMANGVKTIKKFLNGKENIEEFSKYVYENASFFLSIMPDNYSLVDKNVQFVRMNNRGKQLEQHDILKVKLAKLFNKEEDKKDFLNNWNIFAQMSYDSQSLSSEVPKSILSIIEDVIKKDEKIKESDINQTESLYKPIVSYPEFLLIALERYSNKKNKVISISHQKNKLLEDFGYGENDKENDCGEIETTEDLELFYVILKNQYELFKNYFIWRDKNDSKYVIKESKSFTSTDDLSKLTQFQSYLYVSREPHKWMKDAFDWLSDKEKISCSEFLAELKRLDNEPYYDENLEKLGLCDDFLSFDFINRLWFWRLDYYIWEQEQENSRQSESSKVINNYIFRTNRSIEHIKPQHPRNESVSQWKEEEGFLMNSFGNLAMISSSLNSSLHNAPFKEKFVRIQQFIQNDISGTVESLKMLKAYNNANEWNNKNIIIHQGEMINVLVKSFVGDNYKSIRKRIEDYHRSICDKMNSLANSEHS